MPKIEANGAFGTAHRNQGVLVTGASRGLGRETALTLAQAGFYIWAGVRDKESGASLQEAARERGAEIAPVILDVTDQVSIETVFEHIAHSSCRLFGVVNNAGITGRAY